MTRTLEDIAETILKMDPADLDRLLPEIQQRMECCDDTREWERAVISFFIVNAVRFKRKLAAEHDLDLSDGPCQERRLHVVK